MRFITHSNIIFIKFLTFFSFHLFAHRKRKTLETKIPFHVVARWNENGLKSLFIRLFHVYSSIWANFCLSTKNFFVHNTPFYIYSWMKWITLMYTFYIKCLIQSSVTNFECKYNCFAFYLRRWSSILYP